MSENTPSALQGRSLTPLLLRLFLTREFVTLLSLPMAVYVDALLLDLDRTNDWSTVALALVLTYLCTGVLLSLLVMRRLLHRALSSVPDEPPGQRLERLLALPWKLILLANLLMWMLGGLLINAHLAILLDREFWSVVSQGLAVATGVGLLNGALLFILYERMLMPLTLEEFERSTRSLPASGSLFRPRQSWFLPYVLASLLFGTLVFTGTVVSIQLTRLKEELREELSRSGHQAMAEQLMQRSGALSDELLRSLGGTTALLLLCSALTVWCMGRRQRAGAEAIYQSLEGLTRGSLHPPRWVSTDEMGDLSSSVWQLFERLQELPRELQAVTRRLGEASSRLGESSGLQQRTLERQSSALRETDTTAREIRQNSLLAHHRVRAIVSVFDRTAELGRQGETDLQHSLQWLSSIGSTTEDVRSHVSQLARHARELQRVIDTVEELAKRSNLLAINAAIQAVHSGETGQGFTTVAREFRALANRSVSSTHQVRTILDRLGTAIHEAISAVDTGAQGIADAVARLNASGTSLRELALLAQRHSTTAEEITHAVEQQHRDIAQLFKAFQEMLRLTNETLTHLRVVQGAAEDCDEVSGQVDAIARRYGLEKAPVLR
jgi:methyl-accepting chemotaxis protein